MRVDRLFRAPQGHAERFRPLPLVPGQVVTAHRVVVGDRSAGRQQCVAGRPLYRVPLRDLLAPARRGQDGVVGRSAVRIGEGQPAHHDGAPACAAGRLLCRLEHVLVQHGERVPGDGGLERLGEHAHRRVHVPQVRHLPEGRPPVSRGPAVIACRAGRVRAPDSVPLPAVPSRYPQRRLQPAGDRMVSRLEAQHEQRAGSVRAGGERRLGRVEQPARRGIQSRSGDLPHGVSAGAEGREADGGGGAVGGRPLDAQPGPGDHAEDALGTQQHPVRRHSRPRAGKTP
jgi:hypothetical protein